jgi:GNAT superfamily N-acetyltransferase
MDQTTTFKLATTPDEFEQIHRLNYLTFVEEIPQHAPSADGRLVDKFHAENTYGIAVRGGRVIGMIAARRRRPFSLDFKVDNLDAVIPSGRRPVEMRLLSVHPSYRSGPVPVQILHFMARYCLELGDDSAVISGAVRRLPLYRALGFQPFGPRVGTPEAPYQPMILTLEDYARASGLRRALNDAPIHASPSSVAAPAEAVNFLPGPVTISSSVKAAFARPAISHRTPLFLAQLSTLRRRLAGFVKAPDAQILVGSGSLANDVVAGQIAGLGKAGVVLSTGEFGERLADHARRAGLDFHWARLPWGAVPSKADFEEALAQVSNPGWLWIVHHETSTGVLHDLQMVKDLCHEQGLKLCLDCISTIGAIPLDLTGVHLATATSGKALAARPPPLSRFGALGRIRRHPIHPLVQSARGPGCRLCRSGAAAWRPLRRRGAGRLVPLRTAQRGVRPGGPRDPRLVHHRHHPAALASSRRGRGSCARTARVHPQPPQRVPVVPQLDSIQLYGVAQQRAALVRSRAVVRPGLIG